MYLILIAKYSSFANEPALVVAIILESLQALYKLLFSNFTSTLLNTTF